MSDDTEYTDKRQRAKKKKNKSAPKKQTPTEKLIWENSELSKKLSKVSLFR